MARRTRFFQNPYGDYVESEPLDVNPHQWISRSLECGQIIQQNLRKVLEAIDGGLYVGPAGVAFAFLDVATKLSPRSQEFQSFIEFARQLLSANLKYYDRPEISRDRQMQVGFLLGAPGVHAVAAYLAKLTGDNSAALAWAGRYASVADLCLPVQLHRCGGDELFVGRAGYICGALWLRQKLGHEVVPMEKLHRICDSMLESGRVYSRHKRSPCPLMFHYYDTEYLGAAHGLSAILQMFLSVPDYFRYNPEAVADVRRSVEFLISLQQPSGNLPCAMDEAPPHRPRREEDDLVHWCHGAPGVVYLFAKAYLLWRDEVFRKAALNCGDCVWQRGLLRKGPGICHGVAGSGYVFLLLYRLTSDKKHLYRAQKFGEFLFTAEFRAARTPDCPYSLYEGWAGTMKFLADLSTPISGSFPFFDVF